MIETTNSGWDALKHHFGATLCPPKRPDRIHPDWTEECARVTFASSVLTIELSPQGGYQWPWKNGSKTRICLRLNSMKRAQYFVDAESAFASLEKKKKKLGEVKCIQTLQKTSIYDGDVWKNGTDRILYSASR